MKKTDKSQNPFQAYIQKRPDTGVKVPLSFFTIPEAEGDTILPLQETSAFHKDQKYYCYPFNKPVSQFSKLL